MEPKDNPTKLNLALYSDFSIDNAKFAAIYTYINNDQIIKGAWINSDNNPFELSSITKYFGITIPGFVNAIILKTISLAYNIGNDEVSFEIDSSYGDFIISSSKIEASRSCKIELTFNDLSFKFKQLPIVGNLVQGDDCFRMDSFDFEYTPSKDKSKKSFDLNFALIIDGEEIYFGKKPHKLLSSNEESKTEDVKWVDVNKSFKVLHFDKIGVSFDGNYISVYLNAGFSILALQLDFYGLYLSIPLAPNENFGFGLNGLAVSFNRDPISISGGLYHILDDKYKDLYNGEVLLKFAKYGFSALGSYCDNEGKPSFFLYLMISAPMGGPAFFFVNGLVLGMGINRGVKLPDIKNVDKFPLVAAAMGNGGSKLKPNSDIGEVLTELSQWIYPSDGKFFLTAGIKFNSFGLINSFALMTVEFGNKLRFSLLGLSEVSLPPNVASIGKSPIAYARLAIKATLDPSDGVIEVLASLTDESYILDRSCKLTGSFALCAWFAGERKGDFFVSLGGCHNPHFVNKDAKGNPLYPELDKIGINWKINNNLKLKADAYFAVTPACMMAGARLSLTFEAGNLKAWLNASADFLLKWKPFFYTADVSVLVGASYTIRIFGIHKTFSVELSASLNLWGPEFSGKIRINWYIISFTVSFGDGVRHADPIDWQDFSNSFLPKNVSTSLLSENSSEKNIINSINIVEGLLKIEKKNDYEIYWVSGDTLKISTNSAMPCTKLLLKGKDVKIVKEYTEKLGVVPMGKKDYTSTITVKVTKDGKPVELNNFIYAEENGKFPPALWKNEEPGINDVTPISVPMGINLTVKQSEITQIIPSNGSYNMDQLLENESIDKSFSWITESISEKTDYSKYTNDEIMENIAETIKDNTERSSIIGLLANKFQLNPYVNIKGMGDSPEDYFVAYPLLKNTGGQYDLKEGEND